MNWEKDGISNWEIESLEELEFILDNFNPIIFIDYDAWLLSGSKDESAVLTKNWIWDNWNYGYWKINRKIRNYLKTQKLRYLK